MFFSWLYKAHWLNIDVVVGAMICHAVFEKLPTGSHNPNPISILILGLTVWVIYVSDRLLDNRKSNPVTPRHTFHAHYQVVLLRMIWVCLMVIGILVCFLARTTIFWGIVIGITVGLYLWGVNSVKGNGFFLLYKEPITAFVYACAVFGTAIADTHNLTYIDWSIGIIFMLICFQNLLLFSLFEQKNNPKSYNLCTFWGETKSESIIKALAIAVGFMGIGLLFISGFIFQKRIIGIEILMSVSLWQITQHATIFLPNDRYRWVADGVFLMMGVLL